MSWYGWIPRFLKQHGSLILTVLGGAGLIGTVAVTAVQAPKAEKAVQREAFLKREAWKDEQISRDEADGLISETMTDRYYETLDDQANEAVRFTFMEKLKVSLPFYAPVILLGTATMACIAGAHILSARQQAGILAAYGLLEQTFSAYRGEVQEKLGKEEEKKIYIASRQKTKEMQEEIDWLRKHKGVRTFGISTAPGLLFKTNMETIDRGFLHFNRNVVLRGWGDMSELYSFLGIPGDCPLLKYNGEDNGNYGWNEYENETSWDIRWVDYRLDRIKADNGEDIYIIDFPVPPYRIDGVDYDNEECSLDYIFPGYLPEDAREEAKRGFDGAIMRISPDLDIYPGDAYICQF